MAEIQALFYLHRTADADDSPWTIFFYDSLYEARAGNYEEPVAEAFGIFLGLTDIAAPAIDALYALWGELGRTLCAAYALRHEDKPLLSGGLDELTVIDVIAKAHANVIYYGVIRPSDPE